MKGLSSLSCEKPPYFNFGVYNLLELIMVIFCAESPTSGPAVTFQTQIVIHLKNEVPFVKRELRPRPPCLTKAPVGPMKTPPPKVVYHLRCLTTDVSYKLFV